METETEVKKCGRVEDSCKRYGVGRNTMFKLAREAGAVVRIGRIWLCNFTIMDAYMDSQAGEK